jgi:hypothetical protein
MLRYHLYAVVVDAVVKNNMEYELCLHFGEWTIG